MKKKAVLFLILILAAALRLYRLGEVPASLYWDEASLGYNAYAISQTLHDEHGEFLPLTRFMAFGDYKAPGYIYAAALSVKALGLNEFSVRLPSAVAGIFLVLITFMLAGELGLSLPASLLAALFVAISPWSLQFSRGAFEANLATTLSAAGVYFFLRGLRRKQSLSFLFSGLFFALSMYTFNSHRIFVPLLIVALFLIYFKNTWLIKTKIIPFATVLAILILPLLLYGRTREATLRFYEVTWLNDLSPIELANQRISTDGNAWWAKIVHNRRITYGLEFLKHYTDHFRADFLFYSGDVNLRLSTQAVGEMYWLDLPFLLIGIFYLLKKRNKTSALLLVWVLLAPIPAATARETPHALRAENILPVPQILTALGLVWVVQFLSKQTGRKRLAIFITVIILGYVFLAGAYLDYYYRIYPVKSASSWQYGYKPMVEYVSRIENKYPCVQVTQTYGRPYIYFLLYNRFPPEKYWQERKIDRDWYGFWYVHSFGKYQFDTAPNPACLQVREPEAVPAKAKIIQEINGLNGKPVFDIYEAN